MTITKGQAGYWVSHKDPSGALESYGPYHTKSEATEALRAIKDFYRLYHKEFADEQS